MMSWFLFESHDGWCKVHEKNLLTHGKSVGEGESVKYFYNGQEYEGVVLKTHHDHEEINKALSVMKKERSKLKKPTSQVEAALPPKRIRTSAQVHCEPSTSTNRTDAKKKKDKDRPKVSEEEKERRRIFELNKKAAQKKANVLLLERANKKETDTDTEWLPNEAESEDDIQNDDQDFDDDSEDSTVADLLAHAQAMKKSRTDLMKDIHDLPLASNVASEDVAQPSPSKEIAELRRQNEMLKFKLQMAYDVEEGRKGRTEQNQESSSVIKSAPKDKGNHSHVKELENLFGGDSQINAKEIISKKQENQKSASTNKRAEEVDFGITPSDPISPSESVHDSTLFLRKSSSGGNGGVNDNSSDLLDKFPDHGFSSPDSKSDQQKDDSKPDEDIDLDDDDACLAHQLYGQQNDISELIGSGIYCKTSILTLALTNSTNANHFCRRLMTGVYVPSKIVQCTVTGQKWRAGGDRATAPKEPLHQAALKAIVDTANKVGMKKRPKWTKVQFKQMKSIFSNRLIEIKLAVKNGKLSD